MIAAATFEHIVAHLVIQSFSKECREQQDRFEEVSSNAPVVLSPVVDFIQEASLRLSGCEEIEESPSTFSSSSSKPAAVSKRVKADLERAKPYLKRISLPVPFEKEMDTKLSSVRHSRTKLLINVAK